MIVVIGAVHGEDRGTVTPAGIAARTAVAAASSGRRVELVTRLGDDPSGDAVLLALSRAGVAHVATLRDPSHVTPVTRVTDDADVDDAPEMADLVPDARSTLDAADVGLALRYLPDILVIVLVHPATAEVVTEAADGARFAGAHLVVIVTPEDQSATAAPDTAVVLVAPHDADSVGDLVGRYVAAIDTGDDPSTAFASTFAIKA